MSDTEIERLEAEIRESRFKAWDVETFLANRHQAKIDELSGEVTENPWLRGWAVAKELAWAFAGFVGTFTILYSFFLWLLKGQFFLPPFSYG